MLALLLGFVAFVVVYGGFTAITYAVDNFFANKRKECSCRKKQSQPLSLS